MDEALRSVSPIISTDMNSSLTRCVPDREIKAAVFQLGANKAPGLDGYPGHFNQRFWEEIGPDVCKATKSFFESECLLKKLNQTNLVLIPKTKAPLKLSHYRPISLCNFGLKIITKFLANRLKGVLSKLISPNQSTFVPGRMIQDNILIAHEGFHHLKVKRRGNSPNMAVKLDFNKAYD